MISDDERREVAARLRSKKPEEFTFPFGKTVFTHIFRSVFPNQMPLTNWILRLPYRLADLMDRQTCHDVSDFDHESFKCSRCGFRVLSIDGTPDAAKLVGTKGGVIDFGFCPNCGAEVVEEGGCDVRGL